MEIVCEKCGKTATITAKKGALCYSCWKENRNCARKIRMTNNLNDCFAYVGSRKISGKEAKIINEVMEEIEKSKASKKKVAKD